MSALLAHTCAQYSTVQLLWEESQTSALASEASDHEGAQRPDTYPGFPDKSVEANEITHKPAVNSSSIFVLQLGVPDTHSWRAAVDMIRTRDPSDIGSRLDHPTAGAI